MKLLLASAMLIALSPAVTRACDTEAASGDSSGVEVDASLPAGVGRISGKVRDAECEEWVAQASVWLVGTNVRTIADPCGNFRIDGVEPGVWEIRVTKQGFIDGDTTVVVGGGAVTKCVIALAALEPPPRIPDVPATSTDRPLCDIHGTEMAIVAVPLEFVVAPASDARYDAAVAAFPNAEPFENSGDVSLVHWRARWTYRCEECVLERNLWLNGGWWPYEFNVVPEGWQTYRAGEVTFAAPPGLDAKLPGGKCTTSGTFTGEGLRIIATHHRPTFAGANEYANLRGEAIIDGTLTDIDVLHPTDGWASMIATFRAMPTSKSVFVIHVNVPEEDLGVAAAIVGSVRLVRE